MERLILIGIGALLTGFGAAWGLGAALWLLAALSLITVVQRIVHVRRQEIKATAAQEPAAGVGGDGRPA
jgi:CDP-diacylglycerol--glycerol-3-phosphate 3-phosphatidyltransferase